MPVECQACGNHTYTVHYRQPDRMPWLVRTLLIVFGAAAMLTVYHAARQVVHFSMDLPVVDYADQLHASLNAIPGVGEEDLLYAQDIAIAVRNVMTVGLLVLTGILLYCVARYSYVVLRSLWSGNPGALSSIRFIGTVEIVFAFAPWLVMAVLQSGLTVIRFDAVSPSYLTLVLATTTIVLSYLPASRRYFSAFVVKPAPHLPPGTTFASPLPYAHPTGADTPQAPGAMPVEPTFAGEASPWPPGGAS